MQRGDDYKSHPPFPSVPNTFGGEGQGVAHIRHTQDILCQKACVHCGCSAVVVMLFFLFGISLFDWSREQQKGQNTVLVAALENCDKKQTYSWQCCPLKLLKMETMVALKVYSKDKSNTKLVLKSIHFVIVLSYKHKTSVEMKQLHNRWVWDKK